MMNEKDSMKIIFDKRREMVNAGNIEWFPLHHIPNEATYNKGKIGVINGMPDIHLPLARCNYNGLWIELKKESGKYSISKDQKEMLRHLAQHNNLALCIRGHCPVIDIVTKYIEGNVDKLIHAISFYKDNCCIVDI